MRTLVFLISAYAFSVCAYGWTNESTYFSENGIQLKYVLASPKDPQLILRKLPILIYEQGDGTTALIINNTFDPSRFAAQMGQASAVSGFLWAVPELRTQYYAGHAFDICSLDFLHRERDLNAFIDQIKTLPFVDSKRIFLMGHSAGAETVTHVALARSDIHGVINLAGGVSSCSEESADCPAGLQAALKYQCSIQHDSGRIGIWWRQLFLDSQLFASISSMKAPYLALIGDQDTVVSVTEFQNYSSKISKERFGFESAVLPGLNHISIVTAPQTFQRILKFVDGHLN